MNFARILRHLVTGRWRCGACSPILHCRRSNRPSRHRKSAIGGEIRFAVEPGLNCCPLLKDQSARERAIEVFSQLDVWDTEQNNGVLSICSSLTAMWKSLPTAGSTAKSTGRNGKASAKKWKTLSLRDSSNQE